MPINQKKMKALKSKYGKRKGEEIYYATEDKAGKNKKEYKKKAEKK